MLGHADGEGVDVGAVLLGDRGDEGGVEAAGEEEAEGDVGFEAGGDGVIMGGAMNAPSRTQSPRIDGESLGNVASRMASNLTAAFAVLA
jgi:hypothetical protein